jgi:hypothetical protein
VFLFFFFLAWKSSNHRKGLGSVAAIHRGDARGVWCSGTLDSLLVFNYEAVVFSLPCDRVRNRRGLGHQACEVCEKEKKQGVASLSVSLAFLCVIVVAANAPQRQTALPLLACTVAVAGYVTRRARCRQCYLGRRRLNGRCVESHRQQ